MNGQVVAAHAECLVVTRRVVGDVLGVTVGHSNRRHGDPAKQESVEPDIEDKHHVVVRVAPPYAVVHPHAVSLIPVCALVARLAVPRPWGLDHLALGAQLLAWKLLQEFTKLHWLTNLQWLSAFVLIFDGSLTSLVSLDVAWIRAQAEVPSQEQLDADEKRRHHEVVYVEDRLNDHYLCDKHVPEQDSEQDSLFVAPRDRHQGQAT